MQPGNLSPDLVLELLNRGMTRVEIANEYGVTRQAVTNHIRRLRKKGIEVPRSPLEIAVERMPIGWNESMPTRFKETWQYTMLRSHLEYIETGGEGMSDYKLDKLRTWYQKLEDRDLVIEYDPDIPPDMHLASGGWRYVPREDRDNGLILRRNKFTNVRDEDVSHWRLPPRRPWG